MTTLDHRPYLREGDLRTPEDVLEWLWERARGPASEGFAAKMVATSASALEARLDRERRKACRRGALRCWQSLRFWVEFNTVKAPGYDWNQAYCAIEATLAFRAAARSK